MARKVVKMDRLSAQPNIANLVGSSRMSLLSDGEFRRFDLPLFTETILVTVAAIGAIKIFGDGAVPAFGWLITPGILIVAAVLPTSIKRDGFSHFGFNINDLKDSLAVLIRTCIIVLPLALCGLWGLKSLGFSVLSWPVSAREQNWVRWLFYQFMYVALAEEVFFRGYVQSNIVRIVKPIMGKRPRRWQWTSIGISAMCFAVAHVIVQGHVVSALTFLPGLVLGWLFIRTKSLLAPILFHGLANTFYLALSAILA
jgi:membrane protease YdiL (CAAX protease family)